MMAHLYWFATVLLVTYAVTGSALFAPLRHFISVRSWFFMGLVFCPVCFGFWVAFAGAYFYPEPGWERFIRAPSAFIALLLVGGLFDSSWLASDNFDRELAAINEARKQREHGAQRDSEDP